MSIFNAIANLVVNPPVSAVLKTDVIVPDISFWQDRDDTPQKVNFAQMKDAGAKGVIIRTGQGSYADEDFADYWTAAKGILPRGMYWFYDSRVDPLKQAAKFVSLIRADMPETQVWCDYEENYGGAYKGWKHFAVFVAEIERLLPMAKVGIYTGYYYWLANSPNPITQKASFDWFGKYPLWLAWYTDKPESVKIPKPWTSCLYWQFTSKGNGPLYGVESLDIDLSYYQGSDIIPSPAPEPAPSPTPEPSPFVDPTCYLGLYRVKHDTERADYHYRSRIPAAKKVRGLPETCRIRGGKGTVKLSKAWMAYLKSINTPAAIRYLFKTGSGWHNQGDSDLVEQLTFGGNVVDVYKIEGNKAYIKTYFNNATPPSTPIKPIANNLHPLVQLFSVTYNNNTFEITTPVGYARTLIIANPGEVLYMELDKLVRL